MEAYESLITTIALTMGVGWASGINLYAVLLVLGIGGTTGNIALPQELQILQDPLIIGAAGFMYFIEFFADKTPGVDSSWDVLHTFIRIPAGAALAAGAVGDVSPVMSIAAAIVGGGLAATSHVTKAGSRLAINTSPEPVSNWSASLLEDVMVVGGLWTALNYPVVFIVGVILFLVLAVWLIPKLWRYLKAVMERLGRWVGRRRQGSEAGAETLFSMQGAFASTPQSVRPEDTGSLEDRYSRIKKLKELLDAGAISQDEYEAEKRRLLGD